ncbi:Myeloma-overexpressed gene 2 protein-like [Exaiptasia diaphana]|nr:Myeloma-overexpressed gene 2 protein-like [Exaiptasia diaphana]
MKPGASVVSAVIAQDEMFPDGDSGWMEMDEAGSGGAMLIELAANERAVHSDFYNAFDDLFDDDDLQ